MISIKQIRNESGQLSWTAQDTVGEIGRITIKAGVIPEIILLDFEQPEIGDGLIKTAAAFFAAAGIRQVQLKVNSKKATEAAIAAGFIQKENGFVIDPAKVRRSCGGH